jgi:MYXO-CTERM domain-containing protein
MTNRIALTVLLAAAATTTANAAITGTTGACTQIGAPLSALPGALIGPPAYCWNEQTNVNTASTAVNIAANGFYTGGPYNTFAAGLFDSHIIHFDASSGVAMVSGSVTFNANIAAVIFDESLLSVSDATFGAGGTTYFNNPNRSYSSNIMSPGTWLNITGNTIAFDLWAMQPGNYIAEVRVLTHAVPTPGSLALMGLGGLAVARRRR